MFGGKLSRSQSGSRAENEEEGGKMVGCIAHTSLMKQIVKGILKVYKIVFKIFMYHVCVVCLS